MKKIQLLLLSAILFSCSNEFDESFDDSLNIHPQNKTELKAESESRALTKSMSLNDTVPEIASFEDWFRLYGEVERSARLGTPGQPWHGLPPGWINDKEMPTYTVDNGLQEKSVTGYSRYTKSSSSRVMFTSDMANRLGLYTGRIYLVHMRYFEKDVTVPSGYLFFDNESPNCGYAPTTQGTTFDRRGYSYNVSGNIRILKTHIYFVEADEWAGTLNREYPCKSSDLEWNYILWKE